MQLIRAFIHMFAPRNCQAVCDISLYRVLHGFCSQEVSPITAPLAALDDHLEVLPILKC